MSIYYLLTILLIRTWNVFLYIFENSTPHSTWAQFPLICDHGWRSYLYPGIFKSIYFLKNRKKNIYRLHFLISGLKLRSGTATGRRFVRACKGHHQGCYCCCCWPEIVSGIMLKGYYIPSIILSLISANRVDMLDLVKNNSDYID